VQKVSDITRVRVGLWVQVLLRSGEAVSGRVMAHHDKKPAVHTIQKLDGSMIVVEFPIDRLTKISTKPMPNWDVSKLAKLDSKSVNRAQKKVKAVDRPDYAMLALGFVLGSLSSAVVMALLLVK
jgi:hypothetical protein